jgi:hypothetical protein
VCFVVGCLLLVACLPVNPKSVILTSLGVQFMTSNASAPERSVYAQYEEGYPGTKAHAIFAFLLSRILPAGYCLEQGASRLPVNR